MHNTWSLVLFMATASLVCGGVLAQDTKQFTIAKLNDHMYELTTDGGGYTVKVIASVGSDGLLLVDDGQKETVEALKAALRTLPVSAPDIIINTHVHAEHMGGNAAFGASALIIAHDRVRTRMRSGSYLFDENPDEALPDITFADSLTLHFNGEPIKLYAFAGAHDNTDIIIWFTESKLVCVGALSNWHHFPSVDGRTGNILEYPSMVQRVIDLLPEDVTIVPGHGVDHTMADYRTFQAMLAGAEGAVRSGLAQGKDLAALQQEDVLQPWASFDGGYTSRNDWIRLLTNAVQKVKSPAEPRARFFESLYHMMTQRGVDEVIRQFDSLKATTTEGYAVSDVELVVIADKLMSSNKSSDAVKFYELALKAFPEGAYSYYTHQALGDYYRKAGDKELARQHYQQSLELNADNPEVKAALEALDNK